MAGTKAARPETAALPGREYREDKPADCAYCYWWKPGRKCCEREECFYLIPPLTDDLQADTYGDCRCCPYGKHSPCIGFCLAKILHEMGGDDG